MSRLPSGWRAGILSDVVSFVRNGIFARRPTDEPDGVPILRISAVRDGKLDLSARKYVTGLDAATTSKYAIKPDDLLFARYNGSRDLVGRCARVPDHDEVIVHPDKLIRVVPRGDKIDSRFLALLAETQEVRRFIEPRIKTTAGQSGITGKDIREIPVCYPHIAEQRRVVDILEDHLSRLNAATTTLDVLSSRVTALRWSVLASEFAELTATNWPTCSVESLVPRDRKIAYGVLVPGPDVPGGIPMVRVGDIRDGAVDAPNLKRIAPGIDAKFPRTRLRGGEVLLSVVGTIGRTAVAPTSLSGANVARAVAVIPTRDDVSPYYVSYALQAPANQRQLLNSAHEVARKTLNLEDVRRIGLPIPSRCQQDRIVARIDAVLAELGRIKAAAATGNRRSEGLRRALLDAAFSGRLTGRASDMDMVEEMAGV
ncbi:restriction endonuclease subunit S [Micromonospora sp. NPDC049891]|uniref:restriction endonuclease subunit S n=1 Tax=Micromonospora sp. NPDC049891 TaxID=3155655 RepID=UPI003406EAF4